VIYAERSLNFAAVAALEAAVAGCGIITWETWRYRSYFPRVALVVPEGAWR
jgi:hypothetical protein